MIDHVPMKPTGDFEYDPKASLVLGKEVMVDYEGVNVPKKVVRIYPNGDFDGEVDWEEA